MRTGSCGGPHRGAWRSGLQLPDLWWPGDRQWFVATDTDLEWTYLGGSHAFIADVTAALPDLSEPVQRNHRNVSF